MITKLLLEKGRLQNDIEMLENNVSSLEAENLRLKERIEVDSAIIEDRSMHGDPISASDSYWYIGTELLFVPDGGSVCDTVRAMRDALIEIRDNISLGGENDKLYDLARRVIYEE